VTELSAAGVVEVVTRDPTVSRAATAILAAGGGCAEVTVRPTASGDGNPVVLVVDAVPAAAAEGLSQLGDGSIAGLACGDVLDELPAIVAAVNSGLVATTRRALDLAAHAPRLSARQSKVLEQLMAGSSNARISAALHLSEATVKRELAAIAAELGTTTRLGILTAAYSAGYRPRGFTPTPPAA
jgi:DNA-binding NarL/FixJ family response regulator